MTWKAGTGPSVLTTITMCPLDLTCSLSHVYADSSSRRELLGAKCMGLCDFVPSEYTCVWCVTGYVRWGPAFVLLGWPSLAWPDQEQM